MINNYFIIVLVSYLLTITIKLIMAIIKRKKKNEKEKPRLKNNDTKPTTTLTREVLGNGGFPSAHMTIVSSLTTIAYLTTGPSLLTTALFFIGAIIASDAINTRGAISNNGKAINRLRKIIKPECYQTIKNKEIIIEKQDERVGHTWVEVVGGIIVGTITTIILMKLL